MFCKECGKEIDEATGKCTGCGASVTPQTPVEETVFCSGCGKKISKNAIVCPHCGAATERFHANQQQAAQPTINITNTNTNANMNMNGFAYIHKKKWTAFILCLLLGYFGAHRFYVGKTGTGLIWLCTGGLCGIGWVIDLIVILLGGFRDQAGQPLI